MYKRIILSTALAVAAAIGAYASEPGIVVVDATGARAEYALAALERFDIHEQGVTIHTAAGTTEHAHADIDRILIGADVSGIVANLAKGSIAVWPTLTAGPVNIAGAPAGTAVIAYDAAGATVAAATTDTEGAARIDLATAPAGMYVIAAGKTSVKIIKK